MSYLRGSANFVWSTTCVLGKGATGAVYQGVNKHTGEPVAVKTFNPMSHMRPMEVQMREFEVLKKVNHENIVKLLAVEEDVESRSKVLVMELCTGGSLFTILDDPVNSYGLEEEEFLLVLKDLSAGMNHLRDNNIIHRDLKPGNIMKYIAEDGRSVFKLTDFGAARELEDDQQFVSLYGTEEYLHPDMYERAVLKKSAGKSFRANVDLWSIGVTLYHVATGSLPFRPYGGRRNRQTMFDITTKKESGVISGVQSTENGIIEWSKKLPDTCLLSQGLRELVVPLLAGLLECDAEKMWTFECFFNTVTEILHCKMFHVFYLNEGRELNVYLHPQSVLSDLREKIAQQTDVKPTSQLLLFEKDLVESTVDPLAKVSAYPGTSQKNPIYLFNLEMREVKVQTALSAQSARFPNIPTSSVNLEHDASLAKTCCSIAHVVKRLVEKLSRCVLCLSDGPLQLVQVLECRTEKLSQKMRHLKQTTSSLDSQLKLLVNSMMYFCEIAALIPQVQEVELNALRTRINDKQQSRTAVVQSLSSVENRVEALDLRILKSKQLQQHWESKCKECNSLTGCTETASTHVQKIRDSWQSLARDKAARTLSYHDEQFHILEKNKIKQTSQKLLALLQERCLITYHQIAQKLEGWYKEAHEILSQITFLDQELDSCSNMTSSYGQTLEKTEEEIESMVRCIIFNTKSALEASQAQAAATPSTSSSQETFVITKEETPEVPLKKTIPKSMLNELQELKKQQDEIFQLITENDSILSQFKSLSFPPLTISDKPEAF